jgi:hypothetical protein
METQKKKDQDKIKRVKQVRGGSIEEGGMGGKRKKEKGRGKKEEGRKKEVRKEEGRGENIEVRAERNEKKRREGKVSGSRGCPHFFQDLQVKVQELKENSQNLANIQEELKSALAVKEGPA